MPWPAGLDYTFQLRRAPCAKRLNCAKRLILIRNARSASKARSASFVTHLRRAPHFYSLGCPTPFRIQVTVWIPHEMHEVPQLRRAPHLLNGNGLNQELLCRISRSIITNTLMAHQKSCCHSILIQKTEGKKPPLSSLNYFQELMAVAENPYKEFSATNWVSQHRLSDE